jgi:hypothetical protein
MNDFKLAFRQLLKKPAFTTVAVLTLALLRSTRQAVTNQMTTLTGLVNTYEKQPLRI